MPNIERNGLQIHYEDLGEGRPLVLLHGFLFSSAMWAPQVEALRDRFRIITVDFRGHGQSSPISDSFTLYDLVSDVVAVLSECGVSRAVWIGLSMGGMVGLRAAITVPEAVEGLVVLDSDAGTEDTMTQLRYRAMSFGARFLGLRPFLPAVSRLIFGRTTHREREGLVREWKPRILANDVTSIRTTLEALLRRDSLVPLLKEIDVPTLVIAGEEDRTLSVERSRQIAAGIAGAEIEIIPKAGHLSSLEVPETANQLLKEFLESWESRQENTERAVAALAAENLPEQFPEAYLEEPPPIKEEAPVSNEAPPGPDETVVEPEAGEEDLEAGVPAVAPPVSKETRAPAEDYEPVPSERGEAAEFMLSGGKKGRERRGKRRVAPSRKLYGRVGHVGILVVDISESGARIEHYDRRFATRSTITIELEWEGQTLNADCEVVSCRVHRFIPGDKGATVYQSGLLFKRMNEESSAALRVLVSRLVTRGLAEQVANARGIGPVLQDDMPTFRAGVVNAGGRPREAGSEGPSRLIKTSESVQQTGYIRCRRIGPRWERKWTVDPKQPDNGFTVLASENKLDVDTLCETWDRGNAEARAFIRDCARMSIGLEETEKKD